MSLVSFLLVSAIGLRIKLSEELNFDWGSRRGFTTLSAASVLCLKNLGLGGLPLPCVVMSAMLTIKLRPLSRSIISEQDSLSAFK